MKTGSGISGRCEFQVVHRTPAASAPSTFCFKHHYSLQDRCSLLYAEEGVALEGAASPIRGSMTGWSGTRCPAEEDPLVDAELLQTLSRAMLRAGQPGDLEASDCLSGLRETFGGEDLVYCRFYYICDPSSTTFAVLVSLSIAFCAATHPARCEPCRYSEMATLALLSAFSCDIGCCVVRTYMSPTYTPYVSCPGMARAPS